MTSAASGATASRQSWANARLIVAVLAGLLLVAILVVLTGAQSGPPLSIYSTDPDGAMALSLWLQKLGYSVREWIPDAVPQPADGMLFVLAPLTSYSQSETAKIHQWVSDGHTLVVAGESLEPINSLLQAFNVSLADLYLDRKNLAAAQPSFLLHPPLATINVPEQALYQIRSSRRDEMTYVENGGHPVIVSFQEGKGRLWVVGLPYTLSNIGLQDESDASLVANLIHWLNLSPGQGILFDESKHGFSPGASFSAWLFTSAPGWGILLAIALTMAFLALRGRRFGRPVPLPQDRLRREPVEYIQAMANLFRRSRQRDEILAHYRTQFRRRLSEFYAVDPRLKDSEMVAAIVSHDPGVDSAALQALFERLSRPAVSEAGLVGAAADMDAWLKALR
ncbi:MAG TPA: DUF4350 domain-containing protein [Aggregatilineales bacterium]|nr:DUF4350 domain-containing protein [Aggregatilineales bacterium]